MSLTPQPPAPGVPAPPTGNWQRLGIVFGALGAAAIALYGPIGVSATYPRSIGALWEAIRPGTAQLHPYLSKIGLGVTPESMLAVGLLMGGFLAARLSPRAAAAATCPTVKPKGYLRAFAGGFFLLFGARLAGGCTSGHVISGITQLSISGLLFGAGVFATGIATAKLLKGRAS